MVQEEDGTLPLSYFGKDPSFLAPNLAFELRHAGLKTSQATPNVLAQYLHGHQKPSSQLATRAIGFHEALDHVERFHSKSHHVCLSVIPQARVQVPARAAVLAAPVWGRGGVSSQRSRLTEGNNVRNVGGFFGAAVNESRHHFL